MLKALRNLWAHTVEIMPAQESVDYLDSVVALLVNLVSMPVFLWMGVEALWSDLKAWRDDPLFVTVLVILYSALAFILMLPMIAFRLVQLLAAGKLGRY